MKLLLHICCSPCSVYPVKILRRMDVTVMGFFYRHNIHPYQECIKREETLIEYANQIDLKIIQQSDYNIEKFFQSIVFREKDRCRFCYYERLKTTALIAKKGKFKYFSTTLLCSKYQNHSLIRQTGESIAKEYGLEFFYHDFRDGWKKGIETSKRLDMYRQQYCGCIYSEKERFFT